MRRNGQDEDLRRLEREAKLPGAGLEPKRAWLHAVRRARGMYEVQRLARSNDPDLLTIYGRFLEEEGTLEAWKKHLLSEAYDEHRVLADQQILVQKLDVEIDEENQLLEFPPERPLEAWISDDDRDVGRWIPYGDKIPHYVDPIYYVEIDLDTAGEHAELLARSGVANRRSPNRPWVHGPSIWLSGRVDFSSDWSLPVLDEERAARIRSYFDHRGRVLDAQNVYRMVEGRLAQPPGLVRIRPTPLTTVALERSRWLVESTSIQAWPNANFVVAGEAGTGWQLEPQPESVL